MIWKSEFSQPFFNLAHSYGIGINRTVDYSDLASLVMLPLSFNYWKTEVKQILKPHRVLKPIIIMVCCVAFVATSYPKHYEELAMNSEFIKIVSSDYQSAKRKLHIYNDAIYNRIYYRIEFPEKMAHISTLIQVDSIDERNTRIVLDSILGFSVASKGSLFRVRYDEETIEFIRSLSKEDIEKLFSKQIQEEFGTE
ncbi:hypothetical protein [Aureisphaera galaxeae]|uniref:hypothetical protein n=1 Tax=Aureisphaera galaxeae TaxID=1538023 RepID=UPI00234FCFF2|nr:hypothetical protein [Aureisphaera galaxeae]